MTSMEGFTTTTVNLNNLNVNVNNLLANIHLPTIAAAAAAAATWNHVVPQERTPPRTAAAAADDQPSPQQQHKEPPGENMPHRRNRASWEEMLSQLKSFQATHGHCNVPSRYQANPPLAHWVKTQRYKYSQEDISQERIQALEQIGFEWRRSSIELFDERWNQRYQELIQYQQQYGDTRVPFEWPDNKALSLWVSRERQNYKRGLMRKDKFLKLQQIGFDWNLNDYGKGIRPDRIRQPPSNQPQQAQEEEDEWPLQPPPRPPTPTTIPPTTTTTNTTTLPSLPPRPGQLDPHQNKRHAKWLQMYQQLQQFYQQHGHCVPPQPRKGDNTLGRWVKNQHDNYTKGLLYQDQIELLEALGIVWRLRSFGSGKDRKHDLAKFQAKLQDWKLYQQQHGPNAIPPKQTVLGEWASRQRFLYRRNGLPEERVQQLNAVGFVWQTMTRKFNPTKSANSNPAMVVVQDKLAQLRVYVGVHGRFPVEGDDDVDDDEENSELIQWLQEQRELYQKNELEKSVQDQLERLGMVWDTNDHHHHHHQETTTPPANNPQKRKLEETNRLQLEWSQQRNKLQEERVKMRQLQTQGAPLQEQQLRVQFQEERVQWHQERTILHLENQGLFEANHVLRQAREHVEKEVQSQEEQLQRQAELIESQSQQLKAQAKLIEQQGAQLQELKELILQKMN